MLLVLSESFKWNVRKRGAGSFTGTALRDASELNSRLSGEEDFGSERAILKRSPLRNRRRQPAIEGMKSRKTPKSSGLCQRGDLQHHAISGNMQRFTLRAVTDNYKPNGKSCAICGPQLYAPTMRITAHGAPHSTPCRRDEVCVISGDLWSITSQPPVSVNTPGQHNQTNGRWGVYAAWAPAGALRGCT
jgi:hypothetical protein